MAYPTLDQIKAIANKRDGPLVYVAIDPKPCLLKPNPRDSIKTFRPQIEVIDLNAKSPAHD